MNSLSRRNFFRRTAAGAMVMGAASWLDLPSALAAAPARNTGPLAWTGPIGLELYTVRHQMARNPLATLRMVAKTGYKLVESDPYPRSSPGHPALPTATLMRYLHETGLQIISGLTMQPRPGTRAQWLRRIQAAKRMGLRYLGTMETNVLDAAHWKALAHQYNTVAGPLCRDHGMQLFYHNHITEFIPTGGTNGYAILQQETEPHNLAFEMDVFWMTYAKQDPVAWFKRAPGRYPLLHVKDMKKHVPPAYNPEKFPQGFQPFTEVGRGRIDWARVFAHIHEGGVKHIYVEQDRTDIPVRQAIRISYQYLRHLRLRG